MLDDLIRKKSYVPFRCFAEIYKTIPKSKLILIGEGHLKEAIQQK